MELKIFDDPDESFNAYKLDPVKEEYNLEEGDQFLWGYEIMDKEELEEWSWSKGHFVKREEQQDETIAIDYKRLSEDFADFGKLAYLPVWTYPSGRAFLAFESIKSEIPLDINMIIIAGLHPGNNWHGAIVKGYDSLVRLQLFLEENEMKVNFEVKVRS